MPTSESLEAAQSGVNFVWSNTDVVTPSPLQWETVIARSVYKNRHPLVAVMLLVSGPLTYLTFVGKYFYSNVGSSISVLSFTSVKEWQFFYDVHGLLAVVTKSVVWFSINVASSLALSELSVTANFRQCGIQLFARVSPEYNARLVRIYVCVCVCVYYTLVNWKPLHDTQVRPRLLHVILRRLFTRRNNRGDTSSKTSIAFVWFFHGFNNCVLLLEDFEVSQTFGRSPLVVYVSA